MSFQSFLEEVRRGLPSLVYLYSVHDPFLCGEALRTLKELIPAAERDFNLHIFEFGANDEESPALERVLDAANTVSFFGGKRLTIFGGNLQKLKKKDIEKLVAFASNPPRDSVLVLLHYGALSKDTREKFRAFKPVTIDIREPEIPGWIKKRAGMKGVDISDEAVEYLIALAGFDLGILSAEIEKILLIGLKTVNVDDISDIIAGGRRYGIFDLVNALRAQDANSVFRIYKTLKETSDDYALIGAINWQYERFIHDAMAPEEKGYVLSAFSQLHQADIEIKSSGRHYPVEYLLIRLLRLRR